MRTRNVVLAVCLTTMVLTSACGKTDAPATSAAGAVTSVKTAAVKRATLTNTLTLSGKIEPSETVNVVPKSSGKAAGVYADVGQRVSAGATLIQMENNDILAKIDAAKAALAASQANLERSKMQVEKSQLQLDDAKRTLDRQKMLLDSGAIAQSAYDSAQMNYDGIKKDYDMNVASVAASQASVEQNRATIRQNEVDLENSRVLSPISGVIATKNVNAGESVSTGTAPFVVINMQTVQINAAVSEGDINQFKLGMDVDVSVPSASTKPFKGKVAKISPAADAKAKTYPVWVNVENTDDLLKAGMYAEIHVTTQKLENVLTVPSDAVVERKGQKVLYILDGDKAVERKVTLGRVDEGITQITDGVADGEKVITSGLQALRDGMPVSEERSKSGQGGAGQGGSGQNAAGQDKAGKDGGKPDANTNGEQTQSQQKPAGQSPDAQGQKQ
ncbi:efflux RND transporter periplasmic adaptor subunit [Heliobacterium gestii]|uniref:Efflux RND transporter periplasmic adaptor subunit n=1 Tax=Heliomicrobium gestii TaxID=2699 RepID=A0A845L8F8_HELGE|nr:efflux RND transporter periplasmic adaptor subunit [Heliomicrobium gestii]MBM7865621.1 multidrug efflux pump subunit AcrA (membrane-fusion protein) [Heliomicrobium gestii]MZP41871.1 efflux RND transporter periplasmic adaptor subunit [Heliomicrobium gestii]